MNRILIKNLEENIGKNVVLMGRIVNIRELPKVCFVIVQDYTGTIQTVWDKKPACGVGEAVEITGTVKEEKRAKVGCEIIGEECVVIASNKAELPFDLSKKVLNLQLANLLDYRALSVRHPNVQAIFKLYDLLLSGYETVMRKNGFTEIKTPKILRAASEGGANFFKIKYFDKEAYLAQSPQLHKQIMAGSFERVFEIGSTFRAEPHSTSRHVTEYISLDAEMAYIKDYRDVTTMLNSVLREMVEQVKERGADQLALLNVEMPSVPQEIPQMKLKEAKQAIAKKYKYQVPEDTDIDPEGERLVGKYAKEEFNSDFLVLTHYPWEHRPFYTMPDPDDKEATYGFDVIFRGLELVTGSQRIHDYDMLVGNMKKKGVKPEGLEFYLDIFKYAMPPHGGWAIGSERFIQQMLGLKNVKEAILFPRDVDRLAP